MALNRNRVIMVGAVVSILALLGYGYMRLRNGSVRPADGYQAVFLQSGQVYFGKMHMKGDWTVLTDIYYLQAAQALQAGTGKDPVGQGNFQLVKLGTELHAPQDTMYIRSDDISFWENLTVTSRVIDAIEKYKSSR